VDSSIKRSDDPSSIYAPVLSIGVAAHSNKSEIIENDDDVFSDSEGEETGASKGRPARASSGVGSAQPGQVSNTSAERIRTLTHGAEQLSLKSHDPSQINSSKEPTTNGVQDHASGVKISNLDLVGVSDIKAIAADASVFSFGDEDYESE